MAKAAAAVANDVDAALLVAVEHVGGFAALAAAAVRQVAKLLAVKSRPVGGSARTATLRQVIASLREQRERVARRTRARDVRLIEHVSQIVIRRFPLHLPLRAAAAAAWAVREAGECVVASIGALLDGLRSRRDRAR